MIIKEFILILAIGLFKNIEALILLNKEKSNQILLFQDNYFKKINQ